MRKTGGKPKKLARKRAGGGRRGRVSKRIARKAQAKPEQAASDSVFELADALEMPLRRAEEVAEALHYIGYGFTHLAEDGAPAIHGLAETLSDTVDKMKAMLGLARPDGE